MRDKKKPEKQEANIYKIREFNVKYGKFRGPTGRIRDLYSTYATKRNGQLVGREYRYKDPSVESYGRDGLRQAKKSIHKKAPHSWMHFHTRNRTKRRELK